MNGRPAVRTGLHAYGEDAEEEKEASHAEADLVDSRVAHQVLAVLPGAQLVTHVAVEWDLRAHDRAGVQRRRRVRAKWPSLHFMLWTVKII